VTRMGAHAARDRRRRERELPATVLARGSTFVVSQFAEVAGITRDQAAEYLEEFATAGVVDGAWAAGGLRRRGQQIAKNLALCDEREVEERTTTTTRRSQEGGGNS